MLGFAEWLFEEERSLVDPAVLNSYEQAFQRELANLTARTRNPELRQAFQGMQRCPLRNRDGRCFRFVDYIVGSLVRHGCFQQYDLEDSLQRIVFRMLSPVGESGKRRRTVFDFDESRPFNLAVGNPIAAIFKAYLQNELRAICGGRMPALRKTQRTGTVSIGYGPNAEVSPDEIPGRAEREDSELTNDITELLLRRSTPDLPLADLFQSIMRGEGTRVQRNRFGWTKADQGRKIIIQVIHDYARQAQNWGLLRLLDRVQDFQANRPALNRPPKVPKPNPRAMMSPDEADFRSIVQVLERNGRSASLAIFGSQRSRWLERTPRDPNSANPNRLADVLAHMVRDGVLQKLGARYVPGPNYAKYLETPATVAVA